MMDNFLNLHDANLLSHSTGVKDFLVKIGFQLNRVISV
jgi:hypothetical protein